MTIAAPPLVEVDYPCSDDMGDHETQFFIRLLLVGLVQRLMREQGVRSSTPQEAMRVLAKALEAA